MARGLLRGRGDWLSCRRGAWGGAGPTPSRSRSTRRAQQGPAQPLAQAEGVCASLGVSVCLSVCVYGLTGQSEGTAHALLHLAFCQGHGEASVLENEPTGCDSDPLPPALAAHSCGARRPQPGPAGLTQPWPSPLDRLLRRAGGDTGRGPEEPMPGSLRPEPPSPDAAPPRLLLGGATRHVSLPGLSALLPVPIGLQKLFTPFPTLVLVSYVCG